MRLPVVWSSAAQDEFVVLLEYLEKIYGTDSALKLLNQTEKVITQIELYPKLYPISTARGFHKAIINKQISLIYRIKKTKIELLHFWDNRQNPDKMKALLK